MTLSGTQVPPQRRKAGALARQGLSVLLAACIVALAPGLDAYQAFAAGFQKGPAGPAAIPTLTLPQAPALPGALSGAGLSVPALPSIPQLPASALGLPAGAALPPGAAALPQAAVPGAAGAAVLPGANPGLVKTPAANDAVIPGAAGAAPRTTEGLVQQAVGRIEAAQSARSDSGVANALENLFTGGKAETSSLGDTVPGWRSAGRAPLTPLPLEQLKTIARDGQQPDSERQAAVKAIADRSNDASKLALEEIGTEVGGGPADYEIKRLALRKLAEEGKLVSLPPVSAEHAKLILQQLAANKPQVAAFDYDNTLEKSGRPASAETGAALKALADSGTRTMILTDRSLEGRREGDVGILESLSTLTPAQRSAITVGAYRGAVVVGFGADGKPVTLSRSEPWTSEQRIAVEGEARELAATYGVSRGDKKAVLATDYDFAVFLPKNVADSQAVAAGEKLQQRLEELGIPASVVARREHGEGGAAYLTVSKYDKSLGVERLRALGGAAAPAEAALLVGDHFFGPKAIDAAMVKGAPGALAVSVGGSADPRLDNTFVWNKRGHEGSVELAGAASAARPAQRPSLLQKLARAIGFNRPEAKAPAADDPISGKTLTALILQRLPSMVAYMLVTIAFVNVAVPIVGWAGYGILMSLSPMAGIAAANAMGSLIRNMSARNAMALNTLLRVGSLMALPIFHFFGVVNVGTLLLGALAEGWLLSSIMTTEGSFLRVLFPSKQLGNINGALFMMFPGVQVLLGLFLHIGKFADMISPFAIFAGAAAVNLAMVLPIIWLGIPNVKLGQAPAGTSAPKQPLGARLKAFAKNNWKAIAFFLAAGGLFAALTFGVPALGAFGAKAGWAWAQGLAAFLTAHPGLSAPLPIVAALVYWITRSDAFTALKKGKMVQQTPEEKALREKRAELAAAGASADELAKLDAQLAPYKGRQMRAIMLMSAGTIMYYPLYLVAAPHVAETLVGAAAKGELMAQFMGALFFGSLISTAARTKLPQIRAKILGKTRELGAHRLVQAAVALMAGGWLLTLVPGSLLAFAAGVAGASALIYLTSRITDRGWVKLIGVGAATLWLPFLVWTFPALLPFLTVKTAMFASLLSVGLFNGPNFVSLISYMQRNTLPSESSRIQGIQGGLFNAAISTGYALLTIASSFLNPAYPAVLALIGLTNVILGGLFWRAPKGLPGLSSRMLEPRRKASPGDKSGGK